MPVSLLTWLDGVVAALLPPLAIFLILSGLDDLFLDLALLRLRRRLQLPYSGGEDPPEKRTAIFIPLWREHRVVEGMLAHNLAAIRYGSYDVFLGTYPNDEPTLEAARRAEQRYGNVHLAVCPHDGPTSKADCLNWIYQHMLLFEEQQGVRFELVVTHDAEDIIHPDTLRWINRYSQAYDMVQIPVLPLPTPVHQLTHGVYCDEFAEYQTKDVPLRTVLGGFLPSNGVGTGYSRRALEALAESGANRVFEPDCLTEDYENGYRLHKLGFRQLFVAWHFSDGQPVATREYFPQRFRQAVRQRTRWILGIALQSWQRHGWGGRFGERYWFWRDRKGLIGNPVSLLSNILFFYGAVTWCASYWSGRPWGLAEAAGSRFSLWLAVALSLTAVRTALRMRSVARFYGWAFALGTPVRTVWANWLNTVATFGALSRYAVARLRNRPLVWVKTEHSYPTREALVAMRLITADELRQRVEHVEPERVRREVARALPARVVRQWRVLPFKVENGALLVATPEVPPPALREGLRSFTRLEIRFHLVSAENYEELVRRLL
ncbi:MAG: glycosyl transferase family protein [Bryobacterales bacterium]|nr:glycosyl transferase family protein [Bryobacteraceae bacterium]MDW8355978.1 glycosyl transferase family protein [Bryobacterales bacterium]